MRRRNQRYGMSLSRCTAEHNVSRKGWIYTCRRDYRKEKCGTCRHMFIGMDGPFCGVTADERAGDDPACKDYGYGAGTANMLKKYDLWLSMTRRLTDDTRS